jgi:ABC-type molybdenum transport system ATPase subunit/photorepair protein PhrA
MDKCIAITGPAGSGKTTLGEMLAKKLGKCVNIDADHIKHMIVNGFYKDDTNPGGWSFSEWELVGQSIGLLAKNFQEQGYDVVINGYIDEPAWEAIKKEVELTHKFLLLPTLETVKARDKQRPGDIPMGEEAVTVHHNYFSDTDLYKDFEIIDSSAEKADATCQYLLDMVNA